MEKKAVMNTKYKNEEWRSIKGYEGRYEVSNYGRVRCLNYYLQGKVHILHITARKGGYLKVGLLGSDGKRLCYRVHRLVAFAFIGEPLSDQTQIDHIDGNKQNNHTSHLRWTSPKGNMMNEITRKRISVALSNPSMETRKRMSEGQIRRFTRERATHTGRYAYL